MADYTVIDYNTLLPGEPWTSAKAIASFENPEAIAEMSVGASLFLGVWHPYDMTEAGTGDGVIWSHAADGAVSSIETPDFASGYEYRLELEDVSNSGGGEDIELEAYYFTSAAYSAAVALRTLPPSPVGQLSSGFVDLLRAHDAVKTHAAPFVIGGSNTTAAKVVGVNSGTPPSTGDNAGSAFFTHTTAQRLGKARLSISTGTFNGGLVRLLRRKTYA
jgi:hypothetical protein